MTLVKRRAEDVKTFFKAIAIKQFYCAFSVPFRWLVVGVGKRRRRGGIRNSISLSRGDKRSVCLSSSSRTAVKALKTTFFGLHKSSKIALSEISSIAAITGQPATRSSSVTLRSPNTASISRVNTFAVLRSKYNPC